MDIKRNKDNIKININTNVEDLICLSIEQNFIPVIDDRDIFIGIVTRNRIISHMHDIILKK